MPKLQRAKLLRIFLTETTRAAGRPLYEVIVEKCREMQIAGATVLRCEEGFGSGPEIHRARLLSSDHPLQVVIVDEAAKIDSLIPVLEALLQTGTIAVSDVEMLRVQAVA